VLVLGSWVVVTALATLISAAGVSIVTSDVTSDHGRALPAADVVALLDAGSTPPKTATPASLPQAPVTTAPLPTAAPTTPPDTTAAPATTSKAPPVSAAATAPPTATFAAKGGVIAVACGREGVSLVSARPDNGFQVQVLETGPERVVVAFASRAKDTATIAAGCPSGAPTLVDDAPAPVAVDHGRAEDRRRRDDDRDENEDGDDARERGDRREGSGRRDRDDGDDGRSGGRRDD
jgi:hypothetical protein